MTLAELQRWFWTLMTAPEGVQAAIDAGLVPVRGPASVASVIEGTESLPAVERLDLYANMYFFRIRDVLKEDFATLAYSLGEARFHNLVTAYLLAHPSSDPDLSRVGRQLPAFLAQGAAAEPWWTSIAELEASRARVFDRPDFAPWSMDDLRRLDAEDWPDLRLRWAPASDLLLLPFDITPFWEAAEHGTATPETPREEASPVLVWREASTATVRHRRLDLASWAAARRSRDGGTFAEVCEAVAQIEGDVEAPRLAAQALLTWLSDGLVAGHE